MGRVVVISGIAPPQPNAGAARIEALARYLPDFGWDPTVVSSRFAGEGPVGDAETRRVGDPLHWYRRVRHGVPEAGEVPRELEQVGAPPRGVKALLAGALERAVPDAYVGWAPGAAIAAIRAARRDDARALLSSSPPESSHLAALVAAAVTGLPWLAEFRDGWMFEGLHPSRSELRTRVERRLEEMVCRRANMLVGATRGIARDLEQRYGRGQWVPNGFDDPELPDPALEEARGLLEPGFFHVVYTGTFWVSRKSQSPRVLAEAMRRVRREPGGSKILLTIMGALHPDERLMLQQVEGIRLVRHRPQAVALALQRLADALLVVSPPGERAVVTGKFFEYLGSGRPIVVIARDDSELAGLAREVGVAAILPDDGSKLAGVLLSLARAELRPQPAKAPERFHRRSTTAQIANLLSEITEAAPRDPTRAPARAS